MFKEPDANPKSLYVTAFDYGLKNPLAWIIKEIKNLLEMQPFDFIALRNRLINFIKNWAKDNLAYDEEIDEDIMKEFLESIEKLNANQGKDAW